MKKIFSSIVILIAVTGLALFSFNSCKSSGPKKNIGLQLYSIRDSIKKDVPGAIAKVGKMGYKFVEASGYADGKFYNMQPAEFKALCAKNGMTILSSHTGRPVPDSTNFEETMAWWDVCIDAHIAAGAKFIIQASMGRSAYESLEGLKAWCDYFNKVGEKCNAKGIRFGYHNHNREFTTKFDGITLYDYMLENTDPSKLMFQLDLYWCVDGGANPVDYFNKYPRSF